MKLHRYRNPGEPDGTVLTIGSVTETCSTFANNQEEVTSTEVYEKNRDWTAVDDKYAKFLNFLIQILVEKF